MSGQTSPSETNSGDDCVQYILVNESDLHITPMVNKSPVITTIRPAKMAKLSPAPNVEGHVVQGQLIGNQNLAPSTASIGSVAASTSTTPSILKPKTSQLQDSRHSNSSSFEYSFVSLNSPNNKQNGNASFRRLTSKDMRNGKGLRHFAMKVLLSNDRHSSLPLLVDRAQ
jgi:hypothetical protein